LDGEQLSSSDWLAIGNQPKVVSRDLVEPAGRLIYGVFLSREQSHSVFRESQLSGNQGSWTNTDDMQRFMGLYRPVLRRQTTFAFDDSDAVTDVPTYASMSESDIAILNDMSYRLDEVENQLNKFDDTMDRFWVELHAVYTVMEKIHAPVSYWRLYFVVAVGCCVLLFIIHSQLNGNNGSCTNLDDMGDAARGFHHRERVRAQREANNRRVHARTNGARRGNGEYQDVLRGFVQVNPERVPDAFGPELPADSVDNWAPGPWVFENQIPGPYYVDGNYSMDPPVEYGRPRILYADEPLPWVHRTHVGYVIIKTQPDGEEIVNTTVAIRSPCCVRVKIRPYRRRNMLESKEEKIGYEGQSFDILAPFLSQLRKFLMSSKVDEHLRSAAINYMIKIVPNEFHQFGVNTVNYYIAKIHFDQTVSFGDAVCATKIANNGSVVGYADSGRTNNISMLLTKNDVYMPIEVVDSEAALPRYPLRTDFIIRRCSNYRTQQQLANSLFFELADPQPRVCTQFLGLHGLGQAPFQGYANSPNNMNHAGKRIFGAKANEAELRLQAGVCGLEILKYIARDTLEWATHQKFSVTPFHMPTSNHHEICWRALNGIRDADDEANLPPRTTPRFDIEVLEAAKLDVHSYVAKCASRLVRRVTRTHLKRMVDATKNSMSWIYYSLYKEILESWYPLIPRVAASKIPHVKKKLRQAYVNSRRLHVDDDVCIKRLDACIKRELAKFGKAPRLFISYGEGCMYANELPEYVKMCLDGLHFLEHKNFTTVIWIMAKPKNDHLERIFNMLREALVLPNHMFVAIYSDDSVYGGSQSISGSQESFGANVDVSSNDSSQDVPAFLTTYAQLSNFHKDRAFGLIKQCLKPIRFTNPVNRDDWYEIAFDGPFEGSGTTLTTNLNHNGSFLIAAATTYYMGEGHPFRDAVVLGATSVGHTITVESWDEDGDFVFERAQFLKRSPYPVACGSGVKYVPGINIATILRRFGLVENDLTHEQLCVGPAEFECMSFPERFERYASGIMLGWKHEPSHPIIDALRKRFSRTDVVEVVADSIEHIFTDRNDLRQSLEHDQLTPLVSHDCVSIRQRYGLTEAEEQEIVVAISEIQVGQVISTSGLSKIYHVDYGVPMTDPRLEPGYVEPVIADDGFVKE